MSKRMKPGRPPALHVVVTVNGGVASVLYKPRGVAVSIHDYDVEGASVGDPNISKDADGRLCGLC
jgi:hypothetical protein